MHTYFDSIREKKYVLAIKMYGAIPKSQITRLKPTV